VLKPGGRFAVSDVVTRGEVPEEIRKSLLLWAGCIAGALKENEYRTKLAAAGYTDIDVEPTRIYKSKDVLSLLEEKGFDVSKIASAIEGKFMSSFIRARKPV
jgi:arsenite methyltransferase